MRERRRAKKKGGGPGQTDRSSRIDIVNEYDNDDVVWFLCDRMQIPMSALNGNLWISLMRDDSLEDRTFQAVAGTHDDV